MFYNTLIRSFNQVVYLRLTDRCVLGEALTAYGISNLYFDLILQPSEQALHCSQTWTFQKKNKTCSSQIKFTMSLINRFCVSQIKFGFPRCYFSQALSFTAGEGVHADFQTLNAEINSPSASYILKVANRLYGETSSKFLPVSFCQSNWFKMC